MASYWDEGIVTSVLRLQTVAKTTGVADYIARANKLQTSLTGQILPVVTAPFIRGDALQLGYELAAATSGGSTNAPSALSTGDTVTGWKLFWNGGSPNVLFDEDTTIGGQVGSPAQEAIVGGNVAANVSALADDFSSSTSDLFKNYGAPAASKLKWIAWALVVMVALLLVLYTYEAGKSA